MKDTLYEQGLTQSVSVQPSVRAEAKSSILKCYLKSLFRLRPFRVAIVALNTCKTEQRWRGGGGGGNGRTIGRRFVSQMTTVMSYRREVRTFSFSLNC